MNSYRLSHWKGDRGHEKEYGDCEYAGEIVEAESARDALAYIIPAGATVSEGHFEEFEDGSAMYFPRIGDHTNFYEADDVRFGTDEESDIAKEADNA